MSASLNNVTTTPQYSAQNTVSLQGSRVNVFVFNAACYFKTTAWDHSERPEVLLAPGAYSFERKVLTAAVRDGTAVAPVTHAQVTIEILTDDDIGTSNA